jgi:hypothetical protein
VIAEYVCLSVRQPWAGLIALGRKPQEFRSWSTTHRGDLLICAGGAVDKSTRVLERFHSPLPPLSADVWRIGSAIALVELHDVLGLPGDYAWQLRNIRPVTPIPLKGRLSLFRRSLDLTFVTLPEVST